MNELQGTFALVTGASKGLGKAFAIELAKKGYNVLLVARSDNELLNLCNEIQIRFGVEAAYLAIDLSHHNAINQIEDWIEEHNFPISILINNAGYGIWGKFYELSLTAQMDMCRTNMDVLIKLSHLLIPKLLKAKKAYILNVSSTAAYQAVPTLAVYAATKSFVLSFSRALRFELKSSPISVTCLSPGPIETGFAKRAGLEALGNLAEKFNMKPDEVAKIALKGLFSNESEIIPGATNWLSAFANRALPKALIEKMAAGIYKT